MTYWLAEWADANEVRSDADIAAVLGTKDGLSRALESAELHTSDPVVTHSDQRTLLAGSGLDLSGTTGCADPNCIRRAADRLVERSWYFFDRVQVVGLDAQHLLQVHADDEEEARSLVRDHASILLHIRAVGADDFFHFAPAAYVCTQHLDAHASDAGWQTSASEMAEALRVELLDGSVLDEVRIQGVDVYGFRHPALEYVFTRAVDAFAPGDDVRGQLAESQARSIVAHLTTSLWRARAENAALGQEALVRSRSLQLPNSGRISSDDVAFELSLPSLEGASAKDLLALRADADELAALRGAITTAIEQRIDALPGASATEVGVSVVRDIVEPELARLQKRVSSSATLFNKRALASVTTGSLVTTVGLLAFTPLVVPGIVIGVGAALASYSDLAKDQRDIEMSDLHLLWRAGNAIHS